LHRHRINIDVTKIGRTALCSNFPILLYLSSASGINDDNVTSIFSALGANSRKIAVTTNDGTTQCYVEVEQWDNTNNRGWLWVKVPTLSNTDNTRLYFYYNASRPDNTAYVASGICPTASGSHSSLKLKISPEVLTNSRLSSNSIYLMR